MSKNEFLKTVANDLDSYYVFNKATAWKWINRVFWTMLAMAGILRSITM